MEQDGYSLANINAYVGQSLGVSSWVVIDQERINAFADCTGDHQWIHVDVEKAGRASPLGTTIAHGFLTLALLPMLAAEIGMTPAGVAHVLNYGADRIRFINPVRAGSRVRARLKLLAVSERNGQLLLKTENVVEIEGESKPALIAETLMLLFPAPAG